QPRDALPYLVVQDFRPTAGDGIEAGIHETHNRVTNIHAGDFSDVQNLRSGEAVQMKDGVTLPDTGEQVLVIIDFEVRVKAALHEDSRATQGERFIDLLEDRLERLDVSLRRTHRPVKGAKRAVLRANIGVVNV